MNKDTFKLWLLLVKEELAKKVVKRLPKVILRQSFLYAVSLVVSKDNKKFGEITTKDILSVLEQ
jgi:hypothetical protein